MAKSLSEYLTTEAILNYIRNYDEPDNPANRLFPNRRVESLKASWKKSMNNQAPMANFVGFNSEANIISRTGVEEVDAELGILKVKTMLDEEDIIEKYYTPREGTRDQEAAINELYADIRRVVDSIRHREEYSKIRAMADGQIEVTVRKGSKEDTMTLDYGIPSAHKAQPSTLFDNADAKPLNFIYDMVKTVEDDTGVELEQLVTTRQVVNHIASTDQIKQELYGNTNATNLIGVDDVNSLLEKKGLPPIYLMKGKKTVENPDGGRSTVDLFPAKKLVGIPGGSLGEGLHGPTAEERKQTIQMTEEDMILAYMIEQDEPPAEFVKAVTSFLPTLPTADSIYTAEVIS